ncbi:MAG: hypothetical protein ACXW3O_06810 [Brevundimonas sp.]
MSTRFTALESDVLDALAWDLREIAPDLAGQFAESLPGSRRNTGSGLFTELIVDRSRPPPMTGPTGRFGTVHAMVADLPDPIAFQVELREGRLLSLHGDAYGQDTRALDFARVPYDQIFTVDDHGESVAFDPAALMQPSPLLDLHQHADHEPPVSAAAQLFDLGSVRGPGDAAPKALIDVLFGAPGVTAPEAPPADAPSDKADQTSVRVGLWVVLGVIALFAIVFFDVPVVFALILAFVVGRYLNKPVVLSALARAARRFGQYEYRPPER